MQNNCGKPAFLPIFNRNKRPRQALLAHPNNTTGIGAKKYKTSAGQCTLKYQQPVQQPPIQNESPSLGNQGNRISYQGNASYQRNASYQGNAVEGNVRYQGNTGYQGNLGHQGKASYQRNSGYQGKTGSHENSGPGNSGLTYSQSNKKQLTIKTEKQTSGNKSNPGRLRQQQLQTSGFKPGGGNPGGSGTGGWMPGSSTKQYRATFQQQQQAPRTSNVPKQRGLNTSVAKTDSQWQMNGTASSQQMTQCNISSMRYGNSVEQYNNQAQTRAKPAKLAVTKTNERMKMANEHLAKETLRFITASIQSVRHWSKYKQQFQLIFEIYAQLNSAISTDASRNAKVFSLKDSNSTVKCIFYETDRSLPRFTRGHWLRCVGTLDGTKNTFHCVQVRQATEDEQRLMTVRMSAVTNALRDVLSSVEQ